MRKGINQWCFPESWSLTQMFETARVAGFDGVELNLSLGEAQGTKTPGLLTDLKLGDVPGLTLQSTPAEARRIAEQARSCGLEIPSIATALHWQFPLTEPGPQGREIALRMLELAEAAGAGAVLIVPGLVTPSTPYDVAYERALEALADLAAHAAKHKVVIGVENVWNHFLLSPLEFRSFLDQIASHWVKAYFDCGNILVHGFPEQWIRILGDRLARVHVKDFKRSVGNIHGFTTLLQGDVDWAAVRTALAEVGYDGWVTPEVPPPAQAPAESIIQLGRSLDTILADATPGHH